MKFKIFRVAERAWWLDGLHGDTQSEAVAGVFDAEATAAILDAANADGRHDIAIPVNRVYFDTGASVLAYTKMMDPTVPDLKVGRFIG